MPLTAPPAAPPAAPDAAPAIPQRSVPATFRALADAFVNWEVSFRNSIAGLRTWLAAYISWAATHVAEMQALQDDVAAKAQSMQAQSIRYIFSTATTDVDPGNGVLVLNSLTQNAATVARMDLQDAAGSDVTSFLSSFGSSTSTIKGDLVIAHKDTPTTKWLRFSVTAVASPTGYRNVTVNPTGSSSANPFAMGDQLLVTFTRNGDSGGVNDNVIQGQTNIKGTTTGTGTAYTFTPNPAITAYTAGQRFPVTFHADSGDQPTWNASGVGALNLVKLMPDGTFANIRANDIKANLRSDVLVLSGTQAWVVSLPVAGSSGHYNPKTWGAGNITLDFGDAGSCFEHAESAATRAATIAASLPAGWTLTIINAVGATSVTISHASGAGSLVQLGTGSTGTRTLGPGGACTLVRSPVTADRVYISGSNLT